MEGNAATARLYWVIWIVVLVLSAYVMPYGFLGGLAKVYGSFLYWTLFALAAIVSSITLTLKWRD